MTRGMQRIYGDERVRRGQEVQSPLEEFVNRLTTLGASYDQIEAVKANWDRFDGDWTPERRAKVTRMPDAELRREVLAVLGESATDAELELAAQTATLGNMVEVMAWVGEDKVRAAAAIRAERQGKMRPRLLGQLGEIAGD